MSEGLRPPNSPRPPRADGPPIPPPPSGADHWISAAWSPRFGFREGGIIRTEEPWHVRLGDEFRPVEHTVTLAAPEFSRSCCLPPTITVPSALFPGLVALRWACPHGHLWRVGWYQHGGFGWKRKAERRWRVWLRKRWR